MTRIKQIIPVVIAISVGLLTLLGYFIAAPQVILLRQVLTDWAVILGALAVVVGFLNLVVIHVRRAQSRATGWPYGLLTALAALGTVLAGTLEGMSANTATIYQEGSLTGMLFAGIITASQAALAGVVMISLVIAAVRMVHSKPGPLTVVFLLTTVIVLVGWLPFGFMLPVNAVRQWLISVPASAGARGILIGVALGTLAIGLRILTGVERPYVD